MRISPTGKIRNNNFGFTFVELMVVVGIFTIVLLFSIPLFRQVHLTTNASDHVSGLILFLENLKLRAMVENKNFALYMDSGSGKMYMTDDTMDEDARQAAQNNSVFLDGDLQLLNLEFPDHYGRAGDGQPICFFSKGYSDRVLIHIREQGQEMTIQICMFQKKIHLIDKYVSYDDCI